MIRRGLATFVEVGNALIVIQEGRLYRATHPDWDAYCRDRWGFSRSRAFRLTQAAEVAGMLPIGNRPINEGQARELAKAPVEDRPAILREASRDGPATAAGIARAREVLAGLPPEPAAATVPAPRPRLERMAAEEQLETVDREERQVFTEQHRQDLADAYDRWQRKLAGILRQMEACEWPPAQALQGIRLVLEDLPNDRAAAEAGLYGT